jgi:hypothetical protein
MAAGRSSFTKRQKEHARLQKRQDKAEKKQNRLENKSEESDLATNDEFQITGGLDEVSIESLLPPMKGRTQ